MNKIRPYWEEKCWGRVQHIFASDYAATSCLQVKAGWCCSRHRHLHRVNLFTVTRGCIVVQQYGRDNIDTTDMSMLNPGDTLIVPARIWHRFRTVAESDVVEVYWPDEQDPCHLAVEAGHEVIPVNIDDIDRMPGWLGGPDPEEVILSELRDWLELYPFSQ